MASREAAPAPAPAGMIARPGLVKGYLPTATKPPDRVFYILYQDILWECDGYRAPGEPGAQPHWLIVLICPRCGENLTLNTSKKKVEITPEGLQSEPFRCSHPAEFGGVCPFTVALEKPKGAERRAQVNGRWYNVDAVAFEAKKW